MGNRTSLQSYKGSELVSIANRTDSGLRFFGRLGRRMLDGMTWFQSTRSFPQDFPLIILGRPTWRLRGKEMCVLKGNLDLIRGGAQCEILASRVNLLCAELECLIALRNLGD